MQIQHLFARDIFRPIDGVVKADQLDEASIWQELDEFVVTQELDKHLRRFFQQKLRGWQGNLAQYKPLAETGNYPGGSEVGEGLRLTKALLALDQSNRFLERFAERKADLLDLADSYHELEHFYEHQRPTWDRLRAAAVRFALNRRNWSRTTWPDRGCSGSARS